MKFGFDWPSGFGEEDQNPEGGEWGCTRLSGLKACAFGNLSEMVLLRSGLKYSDHSIIRISKSANIFHKNLISHGARKGVFHSLSLEKGYDFSTWGPLMQIR